MFPMLTRRLTERGTRARYRTMVWSAYFWCSPIRFQSAASLIRCKLLVRRSMGFPIGASFLRLVVGTSPVVRPPWVGGFCSPPAPMTPRPWVSRTYSMWSWSSQWPGDSRPPPRGSPRCVSPRRRWRPNKAKSRWVLGFGWPTVTTLFLNDPFLQPICCATNFKIRILPNVTT